MALFALYRSQPDKGRLLVFLSDIRPKGESLQHHCVLPNKLSLVKEITHELGVLGFTREFDRKAEQESEVQFFCVHRSSENDVSSAQAIRAVCSRYGIEASVTTVRGTSIAPDTQSDTLPAADEQRVKTGCRR